MTKDIEISTAESSFILDSLKQGLRLDGRQFDEFRKLDIHYNKNYGDVIVKLGNTKIHCKITCDITQPNELRPFEGLFAISTETTPIAGPQFEYGNNSGEEEIMITRMIEKAVRRSGALDLEALCIISGVKCWSIRADVHFLDCDGGLIDASCIAVMIALLHFRKPDITLIANDQVIIHPTDERDPTPLGILHIPISVTFSFFNPDQAEENVKGDSNNEITILDASLKEELLRHGVLTVTLNKNREVVQISKAGGLPIDALSLMDCCQKAYLITEQITSQILNSLKEDESSRQQISLSANNGNILSSENPRK